MKYKVTVYEVYAKPVIIEAESEAEAVQLVKEQAGDWDAIEGEFSHMLDNTEVTSYEK